MYKFSPFTGTLDLVNSQNIPTYATAPSSPSEGQMYINSTTDGLMLYYEGAWNNLHTLTPGVDEYLLLENGDYFLLENGDKLILG